MTSLLLKVIAERTDAIEGKIERAEEAQLEAERIHNEYKNELSEARRELAHIRQEALEQGAAIIAAAREESARQRDALIADAQAQIEVDRTLAAAELTESVRHLVIDLAGRIVGEPLDEFAWLWHATSSSRTLGWAVIEVWWAGQAAFEGRCRVVAITVVAAPPCCAATAWPVRNRRCSLGPTTRVTFCCSGR
ncbi:hypothetical protein [Streptomyces sp. NPDC055692]|uniref:F0F1 ATP synthase subunit B family protein n=1 Tax=Streptomyces sp. NPDC055692 TaxID=3155683 RepID=UPI003420047B